MRQESTIDRLADALADWVHPDDAQRLGRPSSPGGNVRACADQLGISYERANALLQRMRQRLGPQAR